MVDDDQRDIVPMGYLRLLQLRSTQLLLLGRSLRIHIGKQISHSENVMGLQGNQVHQSRQCRDSSCLLVAWSHNLFPTECEGDCEQYDA